MIRRYEDDASDLAEQPNPRERQPQQRLEPEEASVAARELRMKPAENERAASDGLAPEEVGDPGPDSEAPAAEGDASGEAGAEEPLPSEALVTEDLGPKSAEAEAVELPQASSFSAEPSGDEWERLLKTLEALLFASTEALPSSRLSDVVGVGVQVVSRALQELAERYESEGRPYELVEFGKGWRLYTRREYYPFLLRLKSLRKVEKLTPAALETLAIVAYRQPVIRAEVESIRGVRVGPMLRALLDRKLIRVLGRSELPGAPLQYGTTQKFLDRFGLKTLKDLPSLKEFRQGRI